MVVVLMCLIFDPLYEQGLCVLVIPLDHNDDDDVVVLMCLVFEIDDPICVLVIPLDHNDDDDDDDDDDDSITLSLMLCNKYR